MSVFRMHKSPDEERSDKGIREKLNNHAVTPPSYIWDNVEENLPQKNKRRPIIFWLMPLAACLAGLCGLLYVLLPKNASQLSTNTVQVETGLPSEKSTAQTERSTAKWGNTTDKNSQDSTADNAIAQQEISSNAIGNSSKNNNTITSFTATNNSGKHNSKKQGTNSRTVQSVHVSDAEIRDRNHLVVHDGVENVSGNSEAENKENNQNLAANNNAIENEINAPDSTAENKIVLEEKITPEIKQVEKKSPTNKKSLGKWAVGFGSGIGAGYRNIARTKDFIEMDVLDPQATTGNFNDYNKVESKGLSYNSSLDIRYKMNDKWSLQTGIGYAQTSINSYLNTIVYYNSPAPDDTTFKQKNSTGEFFYGDIESLSTGNGSPITNSGNNRASFADYKVKYTFGFLDIPLHVQYKTSANKLAWFVNGGASMKFLVNKKATFSQFGNKTTARLEQPYNAAALSADISSGISVPFGKFDVEIGPSFSYWLSPLLKAEPRTHLYTTQLNGAVFYNF